MIVDIEGGEHDVLTRSALEVLSGARIVVELHEWVDESDAGLKRILKDAAAAGFTSSFLTTGARDLSGFATAVTRSAQRKGPLETVGRQWVL